MKCYYTYDGERLDIEIVNIESREEVFNDVFNELREDGLLVDELSDIIYNIPSRKKPLGKEVPYELLDEALDIIKEKYSNDYINVYLSESDEMITSFTVCDILSKLYEQREYCEQAHVDAAQLGLDMMCNFLNEGRWFCGLKDESGNVITDVKQWPAPIKNGEIVNWKSNGHLLKPIVWFGIEDEEPIECWSIQEEYQDKDFTIKKFWYGGDPTLNWNILWNSYAAQIWAFWECGLDEPYTEFEAVHDACPIALSREMTNEEILINLTNYCYNYQLENC